MLISSPIWGILGDRFGRKQFVVLGILMYGASQSVFFFSSHIAVLAIVRVISGISIGAPVTLLLSHLITITNKDQVGKMLSYRMAFLTLGVTLSYHISGVLGLYFGKELFLAQSVLSIIYALLVVIFMKEKKEKRCIFPKQLGVMESLQKIKHVHHTNVVFLCSITLTMIAFVNVDKFIDLIVIESGESSMVLGNLKLLIGTITIISNFWILPKCKRFLGNVVILQAIQVIMAIIVLVVFNGDEIIQSLFSIFMLYIVLKSIYTTSEQVFLSKKVSSVEMGTFMGIRQSFTCLGMVIGPIIGGHLYQSSQQNLFIFCVVCLLISSVLLSYIQSVDFELKEVEHKTLVRG